MNGLDEAVGGPPCELVGRDKRIRVQFGSVRSARLREGEDGTRPNVPDGSTIECVAQRLAAREALDEECPDRGDGNTSRASGVECISRKSVGMCQFTSLTLGFPSDLAKARMGVGTCIRGRRGQGGKAERGG